MLKSFKNLVLYDIPPEEGQFLASPGNFLKRVLFDVDSERDGDIRPGNGYRGSGKSSTSTSTTTTTSSGSSSSVVSYKSETSDVVVDDGHVLGLGNPKILNLILSHLSIPDLLSARLVNLRWNAAACSLLRSILPPIPLPPSRLKPFRKLMSRTISNPISSYAIRIDSVWDKETHKFLHRFGPEITRLRVRLHLPKLTEFAKLLQKMGRLKQLHLIVFEEREDVLPNEDCCWEASYLDLDRGEGVWKLGLYKFPKLDVITFENSSPERKIHPYYDRVVGNILRACQYLRQVHFLHWRSPLGEIFSKFQMNQLGSLDTLGRGATAEEIIYLFFHTSLAFHKLRLEVTPEVPLELITDVVHSCSESLVELALGSDEIFERFAISSVLRRLVRLSLAQWSGPVDFGYFSMQFPALQQISLNLANLFEVESRLVELSQLEPCLTVRTLTMLRLEVGVDVPMLAKLAWLFPQLQELFVEVRGGAALVAIYQLWPGLTLLCLEAKGDLDEGEEEETVHSSKITNQSFTGIPDGPMQVLEEMECGCPKVAFPEEVRSCWNIGCLRELRTLLLRVSNSVDNIALLEGIARLEHLENLVLLPFYSHEEKPVRWCLRSIADNFPRLKTLVTSTEVQYLPSELGYLRNKLPKLVHKRKP